MEVCYGVKFEVNRNTRTRMITLEVNDIKYKEGQPQLEGSTKTSNAPSIQTRKVPRNYADDPTS